MSNANMPAMPVTLEPGEVWSETQDCAHGLTKREHFAAMAMQGLIARGEQIDDTMASEAWAAADCLLHKQEDAA